mgnify:CR=1 FL=1
MYKIKSANDLKELEDLVNEIQQKGHLIESVNTSNFTVVYREKDNTLELLNEQDEGRITPQSGFEWDRGDYGQQGL